MPYAFDSELAPWIERIPARDLVNYQAIRAMDPAALAGMPVYESAVPFHTFDVAVPDPKGAPDVRLRVHTPSGYKNAPFPKRLGREDEFARLVIDIIGNDYLNGEVICQDGALRLASP